MDNAQNLIKNKNMNYNIILICITNFKQINYHIIYVTI